MPCIEVSDALHKLIRSFAHTDDEPDETVLARVLEAARRDHDAALRAYQQAEQDISSTN